LVTRQGNTVWVVSRGHVFYENGTPRRVLGIVVDITTRKNAEELLRRSEKLAMVGRLAASIAHEINNPLESVTNLLYLLEHHSSLDEQARSFAVLAQQELNRVAHISRQTLGFYRESTVPVAADLVELLDDILKLYDRKLERKRVNIVRRYDLRHPVRLFPAEVRQVFSNLLMNALEAIPEGGTITVGIAEGSAWDRPQHRGVRLTVADNGHGIRPEDCERIFEPFFTTKGEKGTGLGLWVSSSIVQKHGGSIRLRSSTRPERHGTVFSVFLPEMGEAAEQAKAS
jgi:signal transduction histidine kinase